MRPQTVSLVGWEGDELPCARGHCAVSPAQLLQPDGTAATATSCLSPLPDVLGWDPHSIFPWVLVLPWDIPSTIPWVPITLQDPHSNTAWVLIPPRDTAASPYGCWYPWSAAWGRWAEQLLQGGCCPRPWSSTEWGTLSGTGPDWGQVGTSRIGPRVGTISLCASHAARNGCWSRALGGGCSS